MTGEARLTMAVPENPAADEAVDAELLELVRTSLNEVLALSGRELPDGFTVDADTALFGRGALLDSLGLVSLVLELEMAVNDRFGAEVVLADEKAMAQKNSPFRTVGSLARFIQQALAGAAR